MQYTTQAHIASPKRITIDSFADYALICVAQKQGSNTERIEQCWNNIS